jgi:hypothetical protein
MLVAWLLVWHLMRLLMWHFVVRWVTWVVARVVVRLSGSKKHLKERKLMLRLLLAFRNRRWEEEVEQVDSVLRLAGSERDE